MMALASLLLAAAAWNAPNDPFLQSRGSWGQPFPDAWALERVGLTLAPDSAWTQLGRSPSPVLVAVIDTGLDWRHLDLHSRSLWRNPREIAGNKLDDDRNGYVDDVIGWDFIGRSDRPWDIDGHGTLVAGIIAAQHGNNHGIAGVNPYAQLMVLKAVNDFGRTRASFLAEALVYAADNGARIVNLSVGGPQTTSAERAAVAYATKRGVLIVVAAGNEGKALTDYGIASLPGVIVVSATGPDDARLGFSNFGPQIAIAAPGLDVLSLRARRTDTMRTLSGIDYRPGSAYVGRDKRYYRATGTSFSAPLVTGIASLLWSQRPELTREQVTRMLLNSARDVGVPGVDQHTGYGVVDARAALAADPEQFIEARIDGVRAVEGPNGVTVEVTGAAAADQFVTATLEIGVGDNPQQWLAPAAPLSRPVSTGVLGSIPASAFSGATRWTLRIVVRHQSGRSREARFALTLE